MHWTALAPNSKIENRSSAPILAWLHRKWHRLLVIIAACCLYLVMAMLDAARFLPHYHDTVSSLQYGFSILLAGLFLVIGSLVWLYAYKRLVAFIFFGFSFTMMLVFEVETAAVIGDPLLQAIGVIISPFSIFTLFFLLLLFPRNQFSSPAERGGREWHTVRLLRCFTVALLLYAVMASIDAVIIAIPDQPQPSDRWYYFLNDGYFILGIVSIVVTMLVTYRQTASQQSQQQVRILLLGVLLAFFPLLVLTVIPQFLQIPGVDGQWSTLSFVFLPLALGYAVLRFQILVVDRVIRNTIFWIVSTVAMLILMYVIWSCSIIFFRNYSFLSLLMTVMLTGFLSTFLVWAVRTWIDQFFRITQQVLLTNHPPTSDFPTLAAAIEQAALHLLGTGITCLFILEDDQHLRFIRPSSSEATRAEQRERLARSLATLFSGKPEADLESELHVDSAWLAQCLTKRPLLLEELQAAKQSHSPAGLSPWAHGPDSPSSTHSLVAAIWSEKQIIGLILLGPRAWDELPPNFAYAGPDFELVTTLLTHFSSALRVAHRSHQIEQRLKIFSTLNSLWEEPIPTQSSLQEVAVPMMRLLVDVMSTSVELWWYDPAQRQLYQYMTEGAGPFLPMTRIKADPPADWTCYFHMQEQEEPRAQATQQALPSIVQPLHTFAWLPLQYGDQGFGVLVLLYAHAHRFLEAEQQLLTAFARRCASTLVTVGRLYEEQARLSQLEQQLEEQKQQIQTWAMVLRAQVEHLRSQLVALQPGGDPASQASGQPVVHERPSLRPFLQSLMDVVSASPSQVSDTMGMHAHATLLEQQVRDLLIELDGQS